MTAYDIIRKPVVTEASMAATADRKYTFVVDKRANKVEIAKAPRPSSSSNRWCKEVTQHGYS